MIQYRVQRGAVACLVHQGALFVVNPGLVNGYDLLTGRHLGRANIMAQRVYRQAYTQNQVRYQWVLVHQPAKEYPPRLQSRFGYQAYVGLKDGRVTATMIDPGWTSKAEPWRAGRPLSTPTGQHLVGRCDRLLRDERGRIVITAVGDTLSVFRGEDISREFKTAAPVEALALTPDELMAVTVLKGGITQVWDLD